MNARAIDSYPFPTAYLDSITQVSLDRLSRNGLFRLVTSRVVGGTVGWAKDCFDRVLNDHGIARQELLDAIQILCDKAAPWVFTTSIDKCFEEAGLLVKHIKNYKPPEPPASDTPQGYESAW